MQFTLNSSRRKDDSRGMTHEGTLRLAGMEWFGGKLVLSANGSNNDAKAFGQQDGQTDFQLSLQLDEETLSNILIAIAKRKENGSVRLTKRSK